MHALLVSYDLTRSLDGRKHAVKKQQSKAKMILRKAFFILGLLALPAGSSGEGNAEKMKGILGEPAVFLLNTSEQFKKISWLRTKGRQDLEIFVAAIPRKDPEEKCELRDQLLAYRGRLSVSEDCKSLQISNLSQEDSGGYIAQIWIADDKDPISEIFSLKVYKRLLEADLEIVCDQKSSSGGNGSLQLICSAGRWEEDATFTWAPASMSESIGRSLVTWHNLEGNDLNFTCEVENPVSKASKTVSFPKICSGKEAGSENMSLNLLAAILTVEKVAISVCAGVLMWWKKQRGDATDPKVK